MMIPAATTTYNDEDLTAINSGTGSGSYFGGKAGAGVYQTLINQIPSHDIYIESHLGAGAVMRYKKPAHKNIGIDVDPEVVDQWKSTRSLTIVNSDATRWLNKKWGDELLINNRTFVYADPPYLHNTRKSDTRYNFEMTRDDHIGLLNALISLPCMVMISGYFSELYHTTLWNWRSMTFEASTRQGKAREWVWMNYPKPTELHDYKYLGRDYRDRERIKRRKDRWAKRLMSLPVLERKALLEAVNTAGNGNNGGEGFYHHNWRYCERF